MTRKLGGPTGYPSVAVRVQGEGSGRLGGLTGHLLTQPGQRRHPNIISLSSRSPHFRGRQTEAHKLVISGV